MAKNLADFVKYRLIITIIIDYRYIDNFKKLEFIDIFSKLSINIDTSIEISALLSGTFLYE